VDSGIARDIPALSSMFVPVLSAPARQCRIKDQIQVFSAWLHPINRSSSLKPSASSLSNQAVMQRNSNGVEYPAPIEGGADVLPA